jgi:uncharacterized protein YciI
MERKQFIYTLKLIPELLDENNWSEREHDIVKRHFEALQQLLKENKLILAGRTLNFDESTFGIVILQVDSEEEARRIMENDPAVKEKIMVAELYPYRVALFNSDYIDERL